MSGSGWFFVILVLAVIGWIIWRLFYFIGKISADSLTRAGLLAALFVPLMGATSIFYAMMGEFDRVAVVIGVLFFIIQWVIMFFSRRFQSLWKQRQFKIAFIANSILRMPISYFDPFIFMLTTGMLTSILFPGFESKGAFGQTLILTLLHGGIIQFIYGIGLMLCVGMVRLACYLKRKFHPC